MNSFNRLAVRKEIGAIRHRLFEQKIDPVIRRQIIGRHLANLVDTLPAKFHGIVTRCQVALCNDPLELAAGLDLIASLVPATYGSIPAGTVFKLNGRYFIKRKEGAEYRGIVEAHFHPSTRITIVNDGSI